MKKQNKILLIIAGTVVFFGLVLKADALSTFLTTQGGTGSSTPSGILYGDNGATNHLNTVTIGSNLTFSGGTLSATGGSGNVATSTAETQYQIPWWDSTGATPATLNGGESAFVYSPTLDKLTVTNASTTLFTAVSGWFTNISIGADTLAEYISDTAGAFFTGNTETGITVTYQDADNTVDVVCDTASGSVFGCLASADWTTFNSKQSALTFTYPLVNTAGTVATNFGTTTTNIFSNLQTFTGGFLSNASSTLQNFTAQTGTTTNFYNTSLTSALALFDANHKETAYAGASACSANNFVTTISAIGGTTCGTAAISGVNLGSNLNAHTVGSSLTGTSYNGSAAVSDWNINSSSLSTNALVAWNGTKLVATGTPNLTVGNITATTSTSTLPTLSVQTIFALFGKYWTSFATMMADISATIVAQPNTWTNTQDFTGALFRLPYSASPTVSTNGDTGIDSTSNQLKYQSGSATQVLVPFKTMRVSYASTTQAAATTTRYLGPAFKALTIQSIQCDFSNFMGVSLYDGTNRADYLIASSTINTVTYSTNNTFTAGEAMRMDIGTSTAISAGVTGGCTLKYTYDAD